MSDQATILRGLVGDRRDAAAATVAPRTVVERRTRTPVDCRTLAVTSGKGGVGKSSLALNLAVALVKMGRKVCLLDANPGLGNIDLMCGLNGYWNLSHVVSGARTVEEIVLAGPGGIHVVPGGAGLEELTHAPADVQVDLLEQLVALEAAHDDLLIDTGTGLATGTRQFLTVAERVLVVTTPEPTAIADAYATIKSICGLTTTPELFVLVNMATDPAIARNVLHRIHETARSFLQREVREAGYVPLDAAVPRSIHERCPFAATQPHAPATRAIEQLARRLLAADSVWGSESAGETAGSSGLERGLRIALGRQRPAESFFERWLNAVQSRSTGVSTAPRRAG